MVKFTYKGLDTTMKKVSGMVEANDRKAAIVTLKARGVNVTSLEETTAGEGKKNVHTFSSVSGGNKMALNFLRKFLQLHAGGLAIGDAIRIMRLRLKNPQEKLLAETIHRDVCEGKTIAVAMRNFPNVFNSNTICMVEAGERTGNLIPTVRNLIDFLETKQAIKKKFISGMAYPATVCTIGFVVGVIFIFFVMPRIGQMLKSLGGELPFIAKTLLVVSNYAIQYWWLIGMICILLVTAFSLYVHTATGRFNLDKWSLKIPLIGSIIKENFYCQTANLMSTLLGSGINTTEAMILAENASGNLYFRERFIEAKKMILDGVSVTQAFERQGIFPDLGLDLLSVGENTGDLASSLQEVFKIYHGTLLDHLKLLTTAVTTLSMGLAFAFVGVLAFSVVLSVLKMTSSIKM